MSMLSERKQRQRWVLNGSMHKKNDWSKDSNKFGQKMLERMGWKEGKGLGRNENGLTEHVKVLYKSDSKGIGFKDSVEWSVQQDNFKMLLQELSNSKEDSNDKLQGLKSLEEKSQSSRARVHYKKFTRGKDLSRYSQKDLANIFGKKKLDCETSKEDTAEEIVESESTVTASVLTISGGSMVDYFKNKKALIFNSVNNSNQDESEEECTNNYGFGFNSASTNIVNDEINDLSSKMKKKSKKPKNKEITFVSYVNKECSEENSDFKRSENEQTLKKRKNDVFEEITSLSKKAKLEEKTKKNKKSKKCKGEDSALGITNPAFEPLGNTITVQKHVLGTIDENEVENESQIPENKKTCKRKKKKSKNMVEVEDQLEYECENESSVQKNKKNKSKAINDPINDGSSYLSNSQETGSFHNEKETSENNTSQNFEVKRKKSKKSRSIDNLEEIESINCNNIVETSQTENTEIKLKKKKKSKGLDNPALTLNDSDLNHLQESGASVTPTDYSQADDSEIKCKKQKKKSKGVDNPALKLNDSDAYISDLKSESVLESNETENFEVKRKKKKRSKGIDNPALNLDDSNAKIANENNRQNDIENLALEISECDIMLNVTNEPIVTPKMQKCNTSKTHTSKHKTKTVRFSKTNQEFIIAGRSPDDITKRNELYNINTKIIEDGLKDLKKKNGHVENNNFDIKSIDNLDFCDDGTSKKIHLGIDNQGFDIRAQKIEESVNMITKTIDHYQAEVENGINESKMKKSMTPVEYIVGELNCSDGENEVHKDGVKLQFKHAKFNKTVPVWVKRKDTQTTLPKKSYKHHIRGDVIVEFKNSNLHEITGYGLGRNAQRN